MNRHKGMATWGDRLVPLADFRAAVATHGRTFSEDHRIAERARQLSPVIDPTPVEGPFDRIAVFGGVYNNQYALEALLVDARRRGAEAIYCLGDLGGFGPKPETIWPLLEAGGVRTLQGNYEQSLASGREDCNCGYTDPRDNHFAALSYGYTERHCSDPFKQYMHGLPPRRRVRVGERELLLVHGSPRQTNQFLFDSTTSTPYLEALCDQYVCDGFLCTHTGLHWSRRLPSGRDVVNVGVIGRPANDGGTNVWYAIVEAADPGVDVEHIPLEYDHQALAADMKRERLPDEFIETILTGWWTTCLEILPSKERGASKY